LESRGLKVNIIKTKAMKVRVKSAKGSVSKFDPYSICGERVKTNAQHARHGYIKDVREFVVS